MWNPPKRTKKAVSDSPAQVDFAIGLENSVLHLPNGQVLEVMGKFWKFFGEIQITEGL